MATGSAWIRPRTRWSIYARDELICVYCQRNAAQILAESDSNFLTIDHVQARSRGGGNSPDELVTCCYDCNSDKGSRSLRAWCASRGWSYAAVRARVYKARMKDIERARYAASILLGEVPGVPVADIVTILRWRARRQWAGWQEKMMWAADAHPACPYCARPVHVPAYQDDGDVPF